MRLLLISHGNMAIETLKSAELILGTIENTKALGLQPSEGPDDLMKEAQAFLDAGDNDEPTVVIVDLLGGTPSNVVVRLMAQYPQLQVVSGLNLPMLIDYVNQSLLGTTFNKEELMEAGKNGVIDINEKLSSSDDDDEDED
ncbi:PTS family mannose fructose sorbose porter component IIA [Lactobacillus selangorensis]|uniref:PTS family mannose fructose sorbose porter component IIA n=1 Tax=Lactobacillus selangorensis TaxID=81857 RepID=A0A0R2FY04_9LACO|nr:PTS sugar transporter [Lactobacillus selangorensis]KRN27540.1 PTS family mannose fructose sorbose porter component IIA [Lactobacillus selangorensis]KRN30188.1 PTS family mannose fructose sorbose porter component IIA [Lactobacillus selangorensis]